MKINYKAVEPIIALIVLICVIFSVVYLVKYVNNQEEIKENCGWEVNETYSCYCDKTFVMDKQIELNNRQSSVGDSNWE
jgi:hypothetical protein